MQKTPFAAAAVLALSAALALAGCKKKEDNSAEGIAPVTSEPDSPAPAPADTSSTLSVTGISIGNVAAADKSVVPVATLGAQDPVIVSIKTDGVANAVPVSAKLIYHDGQGAGDKTEVFTSGGGVQTVNITFRNASPWPAGKYRAEVSVAGKAAGSQEFEVR